MWTVEPTGMQTEQSAPHGLDDGVEESISCLHLSTTQEMESRSLCVFFYCLCTTWSLESRSRLGQGYFMCSTAGSMESRSRVGQGYFMCSTVESMESRSLSSTRTQQHYITLLNFDTVLLGL